MQLEIRNAVLTDRIIYNGAGFCWARWSVCSFFAPVPDAGDHSGSRHCHFVVAGCVGADGYPAQSVPECHNAVDHGDCLFRCHAHDVCDPPQSGEGLGRHAAVKTAIFEVGPACVLTSFTTAVAVSSLVFASSGADIDLWFCGRHFNAHFLFGGDCHRAGSECFSVARDEQKFGEGQKTTFVCEDAFIYIGKVWRFVPKNGAFSYALVGYVLVLVFGVAYLSLEPRYKLADQVPDREEAIAASNSLDAKLTGANPVHIMIELGAGQTPLFAEKHLASLPKLRK